MFYQHMTPKELAVIQQKSKPLLTKKERNLAELDKYNARLAQIQEKVFKKKAMLDLASDEEDDLANKVVISQKRFDHYVKLMAKEKK